MTDADRIAALATVAARLEMLGERLALCRIPIGHLIELRKIQESVEAVIKSHLGETK